MAEPSRPASSDHRGERADRGIDFPPSGKQNRQKREDNFLRINFASVRRRLGFIATSFLAFRFPAWGRVHEAKGIHRKRCCSQRFILKQNLKKFFLREAVVFLC